MLKSMTAFGRGVIEKKIGRFVVEIHSLNRRYLEISIDLPKEFAVFESAVREVVVAKIGRGKVNVKVSGDYGTEVPFQLTPNVSMIRELRRGWGQICDLIGLEEDVEGFRQLLLKHSDELLVRREGWADEAEAKQSLLEAVEAALEPFTQVKIVEGRALESDILGRLQMLDALVKEIENRSAESKGRVERVLRERLEEALPGSLDNEERLLREVVLYAAKMDISEEITRLKSHFSQFTDDIRSCSEPIGKKLDFLIQEINREMNTIGSKAVDLDITKFVIEGKGEIEKIREQVQNVE
jgi:uncharacterized protein (TIGR00255 family)